MTPWGRITARARQPKRKRQPLFRCGRCGKGYNSPLGHVCSGGGGFRRKAKAQKAVQAWAEAKRKKQAEDTARRQREREKVAAVRKAEQDKARKRVAAARAAERAKASRKPGGSGPRPAHDFRSCRERDCERTPCVAWREALALGEDIGYEAGFEAGAAAASRS